MKQTIQVPFSYTDVEDLLNGASFDWDFGDIRLHIFKSDGLCDRCNEEVETLYKGTCSRNIPGIVECALNFLNQGDDGIEEQNQTQGTQNPHLHIIDKIDNIAGNFNPHFTKMRHPVQEHGFNLVMYAKTFQHRKAHSNQRHHGEQRGVDQTHGSQG